jgi:hypothetical protein
LLRIAIIGAGVGGCSAAYFVKKMFSDVEMTIYEKDLRIGGRISTQNLNGGRIELGAAFFHPNNKVMMSLVNELNSKIDVLHASSSLGVWNGDDFVLKIGENKSLNSLKLALKYRLNMHRFSDLIREWKTGVQRIYIESEQIPEETEFLFELPGIKNFVEKSFREILEGRGVSQSFIAEVVEPIVRLIYNQESEIGGFAGLASALAANGGPIYRFKDGNSFFPIDLAKHSGAKLELGKVVSKIESTGSNSFEIVGETFSEAHDAVIVATPLEATSIESRDYNLLKKDARKFQAVYKKIIKGQVDTNYFRVKTVEELPRQVLTTSEAPFTNLRKMWKTEDGKSMYSITSKTPLREEALNEIFQDGETVLDHKWEYAYPVFSANAKFTSTRLGDKLFYLNEIESLASAMEFMAFAARNSVRMLKCQLRKSG